MKTKKQKTEVVIETAVNVVEAIEVMEAVVEKPAPLKNKERYMAITGKSEADYANFATQVGRKMHINYLDKLVCEKFGIYTVAHLNLMVTVMPNEEPWEAYCEYVLKNSENPLEIAELWRRCKGDAESWMSRESIIDTFLSPFPKENFEQHGDKNWLTDVSKSWFDKKGLPLDTQIKEMNSVYGLEEDMAVGFDDVIDFVRKYRRNEYRNPEALRLKVIEARFKEITSFQIKEYYVEHLMKSCRPVYSFTDETVPF
jgi:hypothetical protein